MNITMNELFKNKKIWSNNTKILKRRIFKKLGILCVICLFGTATFISGYTANSHAAAASTVLPISRGGTGGGTASLAANNILGKNFANYEGGVLPVAKGGTGTNNSAYSGMSAMLNLQGLPFYSYARKNPWNASNYYFKALDAYTEPGSCAPFCAHAWGQEVMVSGMGDNMDLDGLLRKVYIISYSGINIDKNNNVIRPVIYGIAGPCDISQPAGFMTIDSETGHVSIYIWSNRWSGNSTLTWLSAELNNGITRFIPEAVQGSGITKPEGAYDLYPECLVFDKKS
ncbi:MAG: hypothetical protein LBT91_03495 [Bifidobacteriaceae bacterium]|jgi:hypothetical protein|nr:hypothetical protein [Bifidobacteriaceae bacterium]